MNKDVLIVFIMLIIGSVWEIQAGAIFEIDGITYEVDDSYVGRAVKVRKVTDAAAINQDNNSESAPPGAYKVLTLEIPDKVNYSNQEYKVNHICKNAFTGTQRIGKAILPSSTKRVEAESFTGSIVNELVIKGYNIDYSQLDQWGLYASSNITRHIWLYVNELNNMESQGVYIPDDIKFSLMLDLKNETGYYFSEFTKTCDEMTFKISRENGDIQQLEVTCNKVKIKPGGDGVYVISGEQYISGANIRVTFNAGGGNIDYGRFLVPHYGIEGLCYTFDESNRTAKVVRNIAPQSSILRDQVLSIPSSIVRNDKDYAVTGIEEAAFKGSRIWGVVEIPPSVVNYGENAFASSLIHGIVMYPRLEDYGFLGSIGLRNGSTVWMHSEDIPQAEASGLDGSSIKLLPIELYQHCDLESLTKYAKEIRFTIAESYSNVKVYWKGTLLSPNDNREYIVRNSDCYPGNTVTLDFKNNGTTTSVPFYIPRREFVLQNKHSYQCALGFVCTAGHPEEPSFPDVSGVKIACGSEVREIEAPEVPNDYDGSEIIVNCLVPGYGYYVIPYGIYNGHKIYYEENAKTFYTKNVSLNISLTEAWATKLDLNVDISKLDGSGKYEEIGVELANGKTYSGRSVLIGGLSPGEGDFYGAYVVFYGNKIVSQRKWFVPRLKAKTVIEEPASPTSCMFRLDVDDDYNPQKVVMKLRGEGTDIHEVIGNNGICIGLKPNASYAVETKAYSDAGKEIFFQKDAYTTAELEMTALPARAASNTCAVLAAETNVSELEPGCGFEWRRYDAPPEMPSTFSPCYVANGMLAGKLKNLSANTYYKYRPYYKDSTGEIYYSNDGAWLAFITADAYVYFEPIVYTYEPVSIGESSAVLRGYVLAGSDDIIEQGFQYWEASSDESRPRKIVSRVPEGDVSTILASGQVMQASLSELRPSTEYRFRAFVRSASGENYGTEESFTTKGISSIEDIVEINPDHLSRAIIGYWDIRGCRHETPIIGLNIIKYSDGTVEKVFMAE